MEKAVKTRTRRLALAVILSVMLAAGIPMIVVGAIGPSEAHGAMHAARVGYKVMMGIGIAFTVLGFYGTPLGWVAFGTANSELTIVGAVKTEHLYTVTELAARLGKNEKETLTLLTNCVRKGYLTEYKLEGNALVLNENAALAPTEVHFECPRCGAPVVCVVGEKTVCPYCGSPLTAPKN